MTVLFNSDFEDSSGTVTVPTGMAGWAFSAGAWIVFNASIVSLTAVNGSRVSGGADTNDNVYYTSSGLITDQAIRHASKWQSHATPQVVGHIIRRVDANNFYYAYPETDGANLRCTIVRYQSGSTTLATSSYSLAVSVGDVIHHETKIVGTSIESRIWKNSDARPSTATVTATDSAFSSGYPGMIKRGAGSYYAAADQVVVTDAAGGEDYYYGSAATATTLSGPSSGTTGVASTNFTVGANGTITGTVTVTPGDAANGGTFTPTTVAISSGTPTATFTYTPASTGVKTISISDDGGLTDATSISYTSNAGGGSVRTPAFYQTFIAGR